MPKVPVTIARLVGTPVVAVLLSCGLLAAASLTFLDPLLGPFLQAKFGWSTSTVGLCFGVCAMVYAAVTPIAGCESPVKLRCMQHAAHPPTLLALSCTTLASCNPLCVQRSGSLAEKGRAPQALVAWMGQSGRRECNRTRCQGGVCSTMQVAG